MKSGIFVLLLAGLVVESVARQAAGRPNIVWIVSEDNSPLLGCYGDSFATTPNLDKLALEGVRYERAFATAPVCAPARSTLITGVYPSSMGTQNMRSTYPIPSLIKFFPRYLRESGYYTTNNAKKDYNTEDQVEAWDESSKTATYKNRKPGQPFFAVFNIEISHESSLHTPVSSLKHDPEKVPIPPYHPRTPEMKHDWAQYYDKMELMDRRVGEILNELEEAGLAENTIVFYYSDHGGVLGRSKRFLFESGLRVPLIIRFPKQYAALASGKPGSVVGQLVSFVDFAPTILSLAGIPVPAHMQGQPFLGNQPASLRDYAFSFRGRMDERPDLSRSVRDKKYRYVRNYMPHKIYGQYLEYLWKAPSMPSWEAAYRTGKLTEAQSAFWQPKPAEELYDVEADPHNIRNLADDPAHQSTLKRLRTATRQWILATKDAGFIPEPMMVDISRKTTLYNFARSRSYSVERVLETAEMASSGNAGDVAELRKRLRDQDPIVRYWAVTGFTILKQKAGDAKTDLLPLLNDAEISVRIAAAEALYGLSEKTKTLPVLIDALKSSNRMARVQALNVLEWMGVDARPAQEAIQTLVTGNPADQEYDVRSARRLLAQ